MKIDKLPSGSYRIRKMIDGKNYSITFDHKPTQKEIDKAVAEKYNTVRANLPKIGSIWDYAVKYTSECESRNLSPSTLRGYDSIIRNTPAWFLSLPVKNITESLCQRLIDEYAQEHSPKSVRLMWSFYHSILAKYADYDPKSIKLPPMDKKVVYEPTTENIERIIEYSKGTEYHVALQLAVLGLRRGEICALTLSDLDRKNVLTINKDLVIDKDNNIIIKDTPKTATSNRRILLPASLAKEIRKQGYFYKAYPNSINKYLQRAQDALGIPRFKLHLLRAFSCAYLHQQGFTDSQILAWGGWEESSDVMKRVYRYNLDPEKSQVNIAQKFDNLF